MKILFYENENTKLLIYLNHLYINQNTDNIKSDKSKVLYENDLSSSNNRNEYTKKSYRCLLLNMIINDDDHESSIECLVNDGLINVGVPQLYRNNCLWIGNILKEQQETMFQNSNFGIPLVYITITSMINDSSELVYSLETIEPVVSFDKSSGSINTAWISVDELTTIKNFNYELLTPQKKSNKEKQSSIINKSSRKKTDPKKDIELRIEEDINEQTNTNTLSLEAESVEYKDPEGFKVIKPKISQIEKKNTDLDFFGFINNTKEPAEEILNTKDTQENKYNIISDDTGLKLIVPISDQLSKNDILDFSKDKNSMILNTDEVK